MLGEPEIPFGHISAHSREFFLDFLGRSKSKVVRPIAQFAEESIILPTGPRADLPFEMATQPWVKLLWDEFDNPHWYEYASTGSSQTGKSLSTFAIPIIHCTCEKAEDAIIAAPTKEMLQDKVKKDLKPVIMKSKFAHVWPTVGGAARDGVPDLIELQNGASIKLMSFEGGDKSKAAYTCKNLFFTEIDGTKKSQTSLEANAIEQILARARSEDAWNRRIYMECTASVESGPIWHMINHVGSASRIYCPCPRCSRFVYHEREHFRGWQQARNIIEAEEGAGWFCPKCEYKITEEERYQVNCDAVLVHKGQKITKAGRVTGPLPPTRTLGFRFSPFNSMFLKAASIGIDCYKAAHADDEIDAEKQLCQFVFALPYKSDAFDQIELKPEEIEQRRNATPKGVVPDGAMGISIGMDVRKTEVHWVAIAWVVTSDVRRGVVFDYGIIRLCEYRGELRLTARELNFGYLFHKCMNEWKKQIDQGWMRQTGGEMVTYDAIWIDSRWQGHDHQAETDSDDYPVYDWIREQGDKRIMAIMGHTANEQGGRAYRAPRVNVTKGTVAGDIVYIGHHYHIVILPEQRLRRGHINVDHWKLSVQRRYVSHKDTSGALIFYESTNPREHHQIAKHVAAEQQVEDFTPGAGKTKGRTKVWKKVSSANHFLDCLAYALAAGHYIGFRVKQGVVPGKPASGTTGKPNQSNAPAAPAVPAPSIIRTPSGRSFVATQR